MYLRLAVSECGSPRIDLTFYFFMLSTFRSLFSTPFFFIRLLSWSRRSTSNLRIYLLFAIQPLSFTLNSTPNNRYYFFFRAQFKFGTGGSTYHHYRFASEMVLAFSLLFAHFELFIFDCSISEWPTDRLRRKKKDEWRCDAIRYDSAHMNINNLNGQNWANEKRMQKKNYSLRTQTATEWEKERI